MIVNLISGGHSDRVVRRITGVRSDQWERFAKENRRLEIQKGDTSKKVSFRTLLENAKRSRNGSMAVRILDSVHKGIAKQNAFCMLLAIHNFDTGFKDPSISAAVKLQRKLDRLKAKEGALDDYVEADPALEAAQPPSGAIPAMVGPEAVQDSAGGATVGKDGDSQA